MKEPDIPVAYAQPLPPPMAASAAAPMVGSSAAGMSGVGSLPPPKKKPLTQDQIAALKDQGFTYGLAKALEKNNVAFPLRIWVVDNSGSMNAQDGHRIVATSRKDDVRVVQCTRWKELQCTVEYHAQMAALLQAPTIFRMLNNPGAAAGPQQFGVATSGPENISDDVQLALQTINMASPGGVTPLVEHIREIQQEVFAMSPSLIPHGQRVAIVLATDGLPTDARGIGGESQKRLFVDAMRTLEGLPVWVVIRLCTDDEKVVEFYNELDNQLELSLEVLDDFIGEGEEVHEVNKWLCYGLPLHRIREMGFHDRLFDLLEERKLTKDEVQDFCRLLFGAEKFDGVPEASVDFKHFAKKTAQLANQEAPQWNPAKKRLTPWIRVEALKKEYGEGCSIM